jgi:hypothetical protein
MDLSCSATLTSGKKCSKNPVNGSIYCRSHKNKLDMSEYNYGGKCFTITFSDVVENGVGMEQIGIKVKNIGEIITIDYLLELSKKY